MKRQRPGAAFFGSLEPDKLNEHFVAWDTSGTTVPARLTFSEKDIHAGRERLQHAGYLPDRRDDRMLNEVRCGLHFVHGAADEFVGANNLQARATNDIGDSLVDTAHLVLEHGTCFRETGHEGLNLATR